MARDMGGVRRHPDLMAGTQEEQQERGEEEADAEAGLPGDWHDILHAAQRHAASGASLRCLPS